MLLLSLIHISSGKLLDLTMTGTANGTWLHLWEDVGGTSQTVSYTHLIAREIAAGLVVEGANEGAVHGGEIPQLVAAIAGLEAGGAAAAYLSEAGEAFRCV